MLAARWTPGDVGALAGLRLPTGDEDLDVFRGAAGKVLPLGNGTFDLLLGGTYRRAPVFDTLLLSVPLTQPDEAPPPGVTLGSSPAFTLFNRVGAGRSIYGPLSARLSLDLQWKDEVRRDAGGSFAWLTPGLSLGPLDVDVQVPLKGGHPALTLSLGVSW